MRACAGRIVGTKLAHVVATVATTRGTYGAKIEASPRSDFYWQWQPDVDVSGDAKTGPSSLWPYADRIAARRLLSANGAQTREVGEADAGATQRTEWKAQQSGYVIIVTSRSSRT